MPSRSAALRGVLVVALIVARLALVPTPVRAAYGGLRLPYPPGARYAVTQTPGAFQDCGGGGGSHCLGNDSWAYDFGLRSGDHVVAAHSGTVIRYVAAFGAGSCDPAYRNDANYIVLDHGDGFSSIYWHISYASASVAPGQIIQQGHPIADAGAAGIVCGNPGDHLHFAVEPTPADGVSVRPSVQIRFDEAGEPAQGSAPVSANRARFSATYVGGSEWVVLAAGQRKATVGAWRNTGWDVWRIESAHLGTWGPEPGQDRPSPAFGATRVGLSTPQVDPDQIGWFPFELTAPAAPGITRVHLRPVIDGVAWLADEGVYWLVDRR